MKESLSLDELLVIAEYGSTGEAKERAVVRRIEQTLRDDSRYSSDEIIAVLLTDKRLSEETRTSMAERVINYIANGESYAVLMHIARSEEIPENIRENAGARVIARSAKEGAYWNLMDIAGNNSYSKYLQNQARANIHLAAENAIRNVVEVPKLLKIARDDRLSVDVRINAGRKCMEKYKHDELYTALYDLPSDPKFPDALKREAAKTAIKGYAARGECDPLWVIASGRQGTPQEIRYSAASELFKIFRDKHNYSSLLEIATEKRISENIRFDAASAVIQEYCEGRKYNELMDLKTKDIPSSAKAQITRYLKRVSIELEQRL
jgi:hypothetical protein